MMQNASYTTTSKLLLPSALSRSLTALVYVGSVPMLGVGEEARLLENTWLSVVAAPPDLLELGAELTPKAPIPMLMNGFTELEYTLEPDEMDF